MTSVQPISGASAAVNSLLDEAVAQSAVPTLKVRCSCLFSTRRQFHWKHIFPHICRLTVNTYDSQGYAITSWNFGHPSSRRIVLLKSVTLFQSAPPRFIRRYSCRWDLFCISRSIEFIIRVACARSINGGSTSNTIETDITANSSGCKK